MHKIAPAIRWMAAMFLLVASVAGGLYFTPWAHEHPDRLARVFFIAIGLAAVLSFAWVLMQVNPLGNSGASEKEMHNQAKEGGDQSGNLQFRDVRGNLTVVQPPTTPASKDAPMPKQVEIQPLPLLTNQVTWIDAFYESVPGKWVKAEAKTPLTTMLAIVLFKNPSAPRAQFGIPLKDIEAHLKISTAAGSTTVNAAYWLNSDINRMTIPAGHEKAVVIGRFEGDDFVSHANTHSFPNSGDWMYAREADPIRIPAPNDIEIVVTLIESKTQRTVDEVIVDIAVMTHAIQVRT